MGCSLLSIVEIFFFLLAKFLKPLKRNVKEASAFVRKSNEENTNDNLERLEKIIVDLATEVEYLKGELKQQSIENIKFDEQQKKEETSIEIETISSLSFSGSE